MTAKAPQPMPEKYKRDHLNVNDSTGMVRPKAPSSPPPPPSWAIVK